MDVASAIVGPVVNVLTVHIKQKLGYLTSYAEHVEHMRNRMQFLEDRSADIERLKSQHPNMPAHVPGWLEDVKKIKEDVDNIPSNNIGCFSVKKKFLAGRNALRLTKVIEGLIRDGSDMISDDTIWREPEGCLGRVNSKIPASTSTPTPGVSLFNSRVKAFNDALKLLKEDDDHKARVIALCGMGGVGKTTLKKQLKEVAKKEKMFNWIADVDIGNTPNLLAIQKNIAVQIGDPHTETDLMATYLSKRFEVLSERKEKTVVILDDVWKESKIKLEDIGLANPLPNGVKLLLTSRDENICQQIAVDADSVLKVVKVDVLEEGEARDFFSQIAGVSEEHDHDLYQIGCQIVKKCGRLPLAIKLIASTLKCQKKFVWRRTLKRLKKNDLDTNVQKIIKISYDSLVHDDKVIFLLCGMFPEDYNIPIEDLTRYAWGLKLLERVSTMEDARDSTQTSVSNLKNTYLLMDGDSRHCECVKMHDLVLAFVVGTVSKGDGDGCWIIHHDDFSKWSEADIKSQSCKQISLACKGMSEFPIDFKFPNLTFLKLMQGDVSLRFPQDFYVGMEKLQVIAFEKLEYPLVPTSVQFSANLRTLCLHECSLMFDLNCIGNLSNLEVLSFANSGITILPSTFRNLKKLRLLDVTGCCNLVIDDGVLKSLVKLEELYMIPYDENSCCFTDNCSELAERSKNLCALEFEFFGNNAHMKNMSYEKLKRFKLSVGCYFSEVRDELGRNKVDAHSYQNSLKLITNKEELLKSKISELFMNTDALYLQVNDMNTLEDVDVESPHPRRYSSFGILRLLVVSECTELKYLFTPSVAKNLSKLEYLDISGCPIMEGVIYTENDGSDAIKFSNLNYLRLAKLPKLLHFCNNVDVVELSCLMELQLGDLPKITSIYPDSATSSNISPTQSFLNAQDATRKLEKLVVSNMENLKEIWPPQFSISNLCLLRELTVEGCGSIEVLFNMDFGEIEQLSSSLRSIKVKRCDSLVKLFSCIPFPFLNNLQELKVERCGSIQVLFNTDSGCAGKSEEQVCSSSLRSIVVEECDSLVKLFSCNPFPFLNNLQELNVESCGSIQVLFNTDLGRVGKSEEQVCSSSLRSIKVKRCDSLVKLFSCNPFPFLNNLQELKVISCGSIQVLFNTDSGCAGKSEEQVCSSSLRSIEVKRCDSLVKLFSCNPFPFLNNLQELKVESCDSIQVLFNTDLGRAGKSEEQVCSSSLRSIEVKRCDSLVKLFSCNPFPFLNNLQELKVESCDSIQVLFNTDLGRAGKSEEQVCSSSLRSIKVFRCACLVNLLPSNPMPLFNHLEELDVRECASVEVIFDIDVRCIDEMDKFSSSRLRSIHLWRLGKLREVWRIKDAGNNLIHGFEAVESIDIEDCERFENLITPATTTFDMRALKEVQIIRCGRESERNTDLVESNQDQEIKVISKDALPSLHTFHHLHKLSLINNKAAEVVFEITTPSSRESPHNTQQPPILPYLEELKLKYMGRMSHVWKCDWNEFLILQKPQSQSSFHNLTTITMWSCNSIKYLFSPLMAKLLFNLKKIDIRWCDGIEEVVSNDEDASINSHTTTTFFPHLDLLYFYNLKKFKCIGGGANGISTDNHDQLKKSQASWSLCQYAREISIADCDALSSVIPWYAVGQMQKLQELQISDCKSLTEVFETKEINNKSGIDTGKSLPRLEYITMLTKLKILKIEGCNLLKHIFTFSTLQSLTQLEELEIKDCKAMEVIVTEENGQQMTASDVVVFPHLKSLILVNLPNFVGFFLGKNEFTWPALEKVVIVECPQMTVFTYGRSTAPNLNFINSSLGKHSVECGLNFLVTTTSHQARLPSYESASSYHPTTMKRLPWSYHNLIEVDTDMVSNTSGGHILFSSDKLLQLQKVETVHCSYCWDIEEIFDSQTVAEIPNLRQVDLEWLDIKYICKSKQGTVLKFPNLTRLSIDRCNSLEYVFTCPMVGSLLQLHELHISNCRSMKVIVKGEEEECDAIVNATVVFPCLKSLKLECLSSLEGLDSLKYIWKSKQGTVIKFPNLTRLSIDKCDSLEYVFTCPMVGSLLQLQELHISKCRSMKVIVKGEEEECDAIVNASVVFPCLKSLKLESLDSLEGFCLGKEAFEFPSLDTLQITGWCPKMTVFTKGDLSAPKLYAISRMWGRKYNIHNRLNSVIKNFSHRIRKRD